jgi:hypothetical protein
LVADTIDTLILDLLEWIGPAPRPYSEVIEAWRTSCPRLAVWEEADERGFLERRHEPGRGTYVCVSNLGREHLRAARPGSGDRFLGGRTVIEQESAEEAEKGSSGKSDVLSTEYGSA